MCCNIVVLHFSGHGCVVTLLFFTFQAMDVLQSVLKVNVAVTLVGAPPRVSVMMEARIVIVCPIGGRAYIKRN